jgi:hypothetical protein
MNATRMIELMNRTPFEPLEIHLNNGANIKIEHPYQIATSQKSLTCTIYDTDDRMRIVSFINITEIITTNS